MRLDDGFNVIKYIFIFKTGPGRQFLVLFFKVRILGAALNVVEIEGWAGSVVFLEKAKDVKSGALRDGVVWGGVVV